MRPNAEMRAVHCRGNVHGGVVQVRAGFVLGRGWGAPLSKVRLWAHARRGRRETLDVPWMVKSSFAL